MKSRRIDERGLAAALEGKAGASQMAQWTLTTKPDSPGWTPGSYTVHLSSNLHMHTDSGVSYTHTKKGGTRDLVLIWGLFCVGSIIL